MKISNLHFDLYKRAFHKWGANDQLNMVIEECAELIHAISKYRRGKPNSLLDEMADVEIMLEQMRVLVGEKDCKIVDSIKMQKIARLNRRVNEEIPL